MTPKEKLERIIKVQKETGYDTFIETGTHRGDAIVGLINAGASFVLLHTVELSETQYGVAREFLRHYSHVKQHLGDSAEVLKEKILPSLFGKPCVLWLDAHFSGRPTVKSLDGCETALKRELEVIASETECNTHAILIDDSDCLGTHPDYPTLEWVVNLIGKINPKYVVDVSDGMIVAVVKDST